MDLQRIRQEFGLHRIDRWILIFSLVTLPFLAYESTQLKSNNDVQTWLPTHSPVRDTYEQFKADFGNDDFVILGFPIPDFDTSAIEAIARRLEHLDIVEKCQTSQTMTSTLAGFGLKDDEIAERLKGLTRSREDAYEAILIYPDSAGHSSRPTALMSGIHEVLDYCLVDENTILMAGGPVVVEELDRLGGKDSSQTFFMITLVISGCILLLYLRDLKITLGILAVTVWAISLTMACVKWTGGEMNFIMGALSVMIMVFTLANAIHLLHYYINGKQQGDSTWAIVRHAFQPFFLAAITTIVGLSSLGLSDIAPVRQFGYSASAGCAIALFAGLVLTPCVYNQLNLTGLLLRGHDEHNRFDFYERILAHRVKAVSLTVCLVLAGGLGLPRVQTHIEPLDFLPVCSKVRCDLLAVEKHFAPTDVIEMVIDFDGQPGEFLDRLRVVQQLHAKVSTHPNVQLVTSASTVFPEQLPTDLSGVSQLLKAAKCEQGNQCDHVTADQRFWRISARINERDVNRQQQIIDDLQAMTAGHHLTFTGLTPLLKSAQLEIFQGFWESFTAAFVIISLIMIVGLRSIRLGLLAMLPNVTPIAMVFGLLGWARFPIDIGMMMTASIALGISVDGTFHFMMNYQKALKEEPFNRSQAAWLALNQSGNAIVQATVISSLGMVALLFSPFGPTFRFGMMMSSMLMTALVGGIVFLPAMLCLGCQCFFGYQSKQDKQILMFETMPAGRQNEQSIEVEKPPIAAAG